MSPLTAAGVLLAASASLGNEDEEDDDVAWPFVVAAGRWVEGYD